MSYDLAPLHSYVRFYQNVEKQLTLAWASRAMCRTRNAIGRAGLLHFAGLDGQRSAMVVERRTAPPTAPKGETVPGF